MTKAAIPQASTITPECYEAFFTYSLNNFCILDFDGKFVKVNNATCTTSGFSKEELEGQSFTDFIYKEDLDEALITFNRLLQGEPIISFEIRAVCKDGTLKWLRWNSFPVPNQQFVMVTGVDITEEKHFLTKLKESKSNLCDSLQNEQFARRQAESQSKMVMDIFAQAPCLAAVTTGPDHIFTYVNEAYCNLMGGREFTGKKVKDAIPNLDPNIFQILDRVYKTGEAFIANDLPMKADWLSDGKIGEKYFELVYAATRDSQNSVNGIWCLAWDTTERKRLQNLVHVTERVTALGRMAAGIAHEINNPLAYISVNLELLNLKIEHLTPETVSHYKDGLMKYAKDLEEGILRVSEIVKSMKKLSANYNPAELEKVNVFEVLKTAAEYAKIQTKHKASVFINCENDLFVHANKGSLNQVFLNLIINASQAMQSENFIKNEIRLTATKENQKINIHVKDTGCGIPKENLQRIFDPFFTSKADSDGTGLGLAISYSIIQALDGEISVTSELNQGTEFKIVIPAFEESMNSQKSTSDKEMALSLHVNKELIKSRLKILVVEDEPKLLETICSCMSKAHEVSGFLNGNEALSCIEKGQDFDLIFCDLMMPEISGIDFHQKLLSIKKELTTKIIFMTGGAYTPEAIQFLKGIGNAVLSKPFTLAELNKHVQTAQAKVGQTNLS